MGVPRATTEDQKLGALLETVLGGQRAVSRTSAPLP